MRLARQGRTKMGTTQEQFNVGGMSCSFCAPRASRKPTAGPGASRDVDVSLAHEEVPVRYDDGILSEVKVKDTLRDLGYTIRDPDKAKRYEQQQAELADGKRRLLRRWGLHRRCCADGLDDRRDGALRIGSARDGSVTLGWRWGRCSAPAATSRRRRSRASAEESSTSTSSSRPARLQACLVGCSACSSSRASDRPLFAVSVFITTYHIPRNTPASSSGREPPAVQSLRSPAGHGPSRHRRRKC